MPVQHLLFGYERPFTSGERLHLGLFELVVIVLAAHFGWQWASYLPRIEQVILPLGAAAWVDVSFMFNRWAANANALVLAASLVLGALTRVRVFYLLAFASFHLQYVSRYSLGEISHGSNLVGTAVAGLALGALLMRQPLFARRFAFGFTVLFTAIGYTSAALCKLIAAGITWIDGRHLALWITERSVDAFGKHGAVSISAFQQLLLENRLLATIVLAFGLGAEASAFLGVWPRLRPAAFGAIIAMHVGIWMSMDILFDANLYLLIVLAFPWHRWLQSARLRWLDPREATSIGAANP